MDEPDQRPDVDVWDYFEKSPGLHRVTGKDAETRASREASQRLELYLERSPVAVIESRVHQGIVVWSAAAERIFGYRREEALGQRLVDLLVPEELVPRVRQAVARLLSGEDPGGRFGVHQNLTKDGRRIFCEWHNAPLVDDSGDVKGILSLAADVSEAERERARADESLGRYELLMRGSRNGLWDYRPLDPDRPLEPDNPVYMSEGLLRMVGMSAEQGPKKLGEWSRVVHPEDAPGVSKRFVDHIRSRREYTYIEYRLRRVDGATVWVGSTWQSQWNEAGGLLRFAGALVDITEQRKAEEELRDKLAVIERQASAIRQLGTPILEVAEGVLCLPIIGEVDEARGAQMLDATLAAIVDRGASFLIMDVTGVPAPDAKVGAQLSFIVRAAALLGAETVVTGIRAAVAREAVARGVQADDFTPLRSLRDGLAYCLRARAARAPNAAGPAARPRR
jgi:PAS domain S-box-containing protein